MNAQLGADAIDALTAAAERDGSAFLPARGGAPAVPVPGPGLILAARSSPEPLVTCQVPGLGATANPRFIGMTQRGTRLRGLVCELLTDTPPGPAGSVEFVTAISYAPATPARAAKMLVTWARTASGFAAGKATAVDISVRGAGGRLALDRYETARDGKVLDVRRPATGLPSRRLDEMLVAQLITAALLGAAR